METRADICVIGGGAAGMVAALSAARGFKAAAYGGSVVILERNRVVGRKLAITGKGRANVTNARSKEEFVRAFGPSGRFLYPAFESFFSDDLVTMFAEAGLQLKTERGGRVFPITDKAQDVVQAFAQLLVRDGVDTLYSARVRSIDAGPGGWTIGLESGKPVRCRAIIVATGGMSYPGTGSTGDGYGLLEHMGHHTSPLLPGLVSLHCAEKWLGELAGTSLEGVAVEAWVGRKLLGRSHGEVMITDRGVGGPAVLSLSLAVVPALAEGQDVALHMDLRPELGVDREIHDMEACGNAEAVLAYVLKFLPKRMALQLMSVWGIEGKGRTPLPRKTLAAIAKSVKGVELRCTGTDPLASAIITHGGIVLQEVDPRSMGSKVVPGLFIAGELLDLQAVTGGYNLQAAFSTGFLAGRCAAEYVAKSANDGRL
ncbi:MAG: aminoacetone oxidase family FAD-binding enzyme [Caldiserica bacterium]|nr:aminoacetone oxidase family FAD-binding enzyme [Caldisericota bacterium]